MTDSAEKLLREVYEHVKWRDLPIELLDRIRAHLATPAQLAEVNGGWLPIESAPKNHLPILVYGPYGQLIAFKDITWAWWPIPATEKLEYTPTHWQPLPAAPTPAASVTDERK